MEVTVLIQAVGLAYQAATATPVVSSAMGSTATGGQSLQGLGGVYCTTSTTISPEATTTVTTTATLLVASGIKN